LKDRGGGEGDEKGKLRRRRRKKNDIENKTKETNLSLNLTAASSCFFSDRCSLFKKKSGVSRRFMITGTGAGGWSFSIFPFSIE